jgi:CRP-like cAMP-binding protein
VIIRNSSTLRVSEPVWTHQREAAPKDPLQALDTLVLRMECARGQQIYKEDSSVEYWYRMESGVARRFSARADGRRQIVDLLLPGDFFGFGVGGKHHFAVEAVLDGTVVARYPRSRLESLAELDPRIARRLRDVACTAMSRLHGLILNLGRTTSVEQPQRKRLLTFLSGWPTVWRAVPRIGSYCRCRERILPIISLFRSRP